MTDKDKPIVSIEDVNEANILLQILEQEQIPHRVEYFQGANSGVYQLVDPMAGAYYCRVFGFAADEARILELLREVREAQVMETDAAYAAEFAAEDLDAAEIAALNAEQGDGSDNSEV